MKVSLNWLKLYLDIDLPPEEISEMLTGIGLEVEGMHEIESVKGGLKGVVIGLVKTCEKHPQADRLSLTKVDIGNGEALQIVCGAPNVAAGQKVVVATVGTTLYDAEGKSFSIKKSKIRGELSEGMICAEDELGLGTDHSGIIVLPNDARVGTQAADYFKIENDVVFEIGLTPNRSDANCHIGVAKDLAAFLKINKNHNGKVNMPDTSGFRVENHDLVLDVVVENAEACPRYSGVSISGVTVKESPDWLKNRLNAIGVRPLNNIVDVTNFVLHELGQPLHAFDADRIKGGKVVVKTLPDGTLFKSLDEVDRKLSANDLMICDGESNGMCIAGVFGGINSGVTEKTTKIFLESAHFNPKWIRRTSMHHALRTDAATCFEKGSDPDITAYALQRAAMLILELAGGKIASEVVDIYPKKIEKAKVEVKYANINRLIGIDIPIPEIKAILAALEMEIAPESKTGFTVAIPTNKNEVTREADVIEEILRIYGFNKVPVSNQVRSAVTYSKKPEPQQIKNAIGEMLTASGFNEIMAVSLTESRYFSQMLPLDNDDLVFVNNISNIHLDVMRPVMLFSGLEAVLYNQNRQNTDLKLYEFGKTYRKAKDGFSEQDHLSLFLSGAKHAESWVSPKSEVVSFFTLKASVANILSRLGVASFGQSAIQDNIYSFGLKYHRGNENLVTFGKVRADVLKKMDIKNEVFYADFNWNAIMVSLKNYKVEFVELSRFPSVRRDLALIIENSVKFQDIADIAAKTGKKLLKDINLFSIYENEEKLGKGKKSYAVSFVFQDAEKTLKDSEVENIMNKLIELYEGKLGAVIRR